jgi:hypothetical protein
MIELKIENLLKEILTELRLIREKISAGEKTFPDTWLTREGTYNTYPSQTYTDCNCPPNTVCMNAACPRAMKVT